MEKLFRTIVFVSAALYVVWYLMPYYDYLWLSEEGLSLANASSYGSYIPNHPLIYWGVFSLWVALSIGVFLFIPLARTGFLVMTVVTVVAGFFGGFVVLDPVSASIGNIITLSDGAIIAMAYLTSVSNKFVTAPEELQSRGINPPEPDQIEEQDVTENVGPWVTIAQFTTGPEAHILRARLESEDIPAVVADEHLVTANWFLSNAVGGVRVRVPQLYAEQAYIIVKGIELGSYNITDDEEEDVRLCPKCRSDKIIEYKRSWKISFLIFYFFHVPVPYYANEYKCEKCGNIWRESSNKSIDPTKNTPSNGM